VEEGEEAVAELLAQPGDVLPAADVGDPGDDRHHPLPVGIVLVGEGGDGTAEHRVALGVGRDQRAVHDLAGMRHPLGDLHRHAVRPPVARLGVLDAAERAPHRPHRQGGAHEPVAVEEDGADAEQPELGGVVEPDREGGHHRREQHQPGERPREDLEQAPLRRRGERREPGAGEHRGGF